LFVADLFHPVNRFAVELFLNGDTGHRGGGVAPCCGLNSGSTRTVPMKYSAGPLPEGCEPLRLISIVLNPYCS
jgi:hypothetical protein